MKYSVENIVEEISSWDANAREEFLRLISVNLTFSVNVIINNKEMSDQDKLREIGLVNEFHHRLHSWVTGPNDMQDGKDEFAERIFGLLKHYSSRMAKKGAVEFPVVSAYETVKKSMTGEA